MDDTFIYTRNQSIHVMLMIIIVDVVDLVGVKGFMTETVLLVLTTLVIYT